MRCSANLQSTAEFVPSDFGAVGSGVCAVAARGRLATIPAMSSRVTKGIQTLPSSALLLLGLAACAAGELPPSVWPPPNFELVVDELEVDGGSMHVVRRFSVDASGVVIYGESSRPLLDEETGLSVPVFDRLSVYRLEPMAVRSLARKTSRTGIGELAVEAPDVASDVGLSIVWQAFGQRRVLSAAGRLRGALGEVVALVSAHLPPGESFRVQGSRPAVSVLRGVPAPATGAAGALAALLAQLERRPDDAALLLDAYALACRAGDLGVATDLLERWDRASRVARRQGAFVDDAGSAPKLRAADLRQFLPS